MLFNQSLENFDLESYCFVDENGFEKSIDFNCPPAADFIVDHINVSLNVNYGQILMEQINQLQRNNKTLIEIEQKYKLFINSLTETIQKRDRTVNELELKLNKNSTNLIKLQQFVKNKLYEMEVYKQKYVREKYLNRQLRRSEVSTQSGSLYINKLADVESSDILSELSGICLVCEHKFSITSNAIGENCCGVVIDECHNHDV